MIYFSTLNFRAILLILFTSIFIMVTNKQNDYKVESGKKSSSIFKHLEHVNPSIRTFQFYYKPETAVEKLIKLKIKSLEPFLQDNDTYRDDEHDEKVETTMIEPLHSPEEFLRQNVKIKEKHGNLDIEKYRKMKNKIIRALHKESISDKTKYIVNKTLEDLMGPLLRSECVWKTGSGILRNGNYKSLNLPSLNNWKKQWQKIKNSDSPFTDLYEYFVKLFIGQTSAPNKKSKHKLRCEILYDAIKCETEEANSARKQRENHGKFKANNQNLYCNNFKVCSMELRDFMLNFYLSLNNTAISNLKNYAEMFVRDVNTLSRHERSVVYSVIKSISEIVERKLNRTFRRETLRFKLDEEKNSEKNIKYLKSYIVNTIELVKNKTFTCLKRDGWTLSPKTRNLVEKDLRENIDIEMNNLGRELRKSICPMFEICNNKYDSRREYSEREKSDLFLKLHVTVDHDLNKISIESTSMEKNDLVDSEKENERRFGETIKSENQQAAVENISMTPILQVKNITRPTFKFINEKMLNESDLNTTRIGTNSSFGNKPISYSTLGLRTFEIIKIDNITVEKY